VIALFTIRSHTNHRHARSPILQPMISFKGMHMGISFWRGAFFGCVCVWLGDLIRQVAVNCLMVWLGWLGWLQIPQGIVKKGMHWRIRCWCGALTLLASAERFCLDRQAMQAAALGQPAPSPAIQPSPRRQPSDFFRQAGQCRMQP
jgi:hypothetical protein